MQANNYPDTHAVYQEAVLHITNEQSQFYDWWLQQFSTSDPYVVDQTRTDLKWNGQDAISLANTFAVQVKMLIEHTNDTMTPSQRHAVTNQGLWLPSILWYRAIDLVYGRY